MRKTLTTLTAVLLALAPAGCRKVCDCVTPDTETTDTGTEPAADSSTDPTGDPTGDPTDDPGADPDASDPVEEEPAGDREARGLWVTRWNYGSAADIETIMDDAAAGGFNQVYFQIRGTADAYYDSTVEPWAEALGSDPGWDPLAVAVTEAHARGLQLHAYLNTFPVWSGSSPPAAADHIYNAHPDWICADSSGTPMPLGSGYVFGSPGNDGLQDHIASVVADIVGRYDVDGIHMDYVRYPGVDYCHDATSNTRFAAAQAADPSLTRADWQRDQITATVSKIRSAIDAADPSIHLTVAVWGIYQNTWGWSSVSKGYDDYYQDPRAWSALGLIDAAAPMIYWSIKEPYGSRLDFRAIVDDHITGMPDTMVYAGIEGDYDTFDEIANQIDYVRAQGGAGYVIFAYSYLVDHAYLDDLAAGPNAEPALPP